MTGKIESPNGHQYDSPDKVKDNKKGALERIHRLIRSFTYKISSWFAKKIKVGDQSGASLNPDKLLGLHIARYVSVTTPRRRGVIQKLVYSIHKFLLKLQLKTAIKLCLNSQLKNKSVELFSQFSHLFSQFSHLKRSNFSLSLEDLSSIINIAWPVIHRDIKEKALSLPKNSTREKKEKELISHINTLVFAWFIKFKEAIDSPDEDANAIIKNTTSLQESKVSFCDHCRKELITKAQKDGLLSKPKRSNHQKKKVFSTILSRRIPKTKNTKKHFGRSITKNTKKTIHYIRIQPKDLITKEQHEGLLSKKR